MRPNLLSMIRSLVLTPLWVAQIATKAKSFRDNPVLGSPLLNAWGLHAARRRLADSMSLRRRARLAGGVTTQERLGFENLGYFLRHDALEAEQFAALQGEIREIRLPAREMRQGGTVTRRIGLDDSWLVGMPATRRFVKDPMVRALIHYAASYRGEPTFQVQTILADPNGKEVDPQTFLHSDTFHPTAKAWLFLDDVGDDDGPFAYVPGSHRLTPQRLAWERAQSLSAASSPDQMHSEGSFRATEEDLAALCLPAPVRMVVPANTLIVADTSGFHRRTASLRHTRRVEVYATLRRTPFVPWAGGHLAALPPFAGRLSELEMALQRALESRGLAHSAWRLVGETGAYDSAKI
jgi:Phytanoyl-CoA dioxygenase (PhyH)